MTMLYTHLRLTIHISVTFLSFHLSSYPFTQSLPKLRATFLQLLTLATKLLSVQRGFEIVTGTGYFGLLSPTYFLSTPDPCCRHVKPSQASSPV